MTETMFAEGAAFIDGRFVPIREARIPILDRGFVRSDATYDVFHVWRGMAFRLEDHLKRFARNMKGLHLDPRLDREAIGDIALECVRLSGLRDAYVQITCTRGVPPKGTRDPRACENRFYAFAVPFVWIANEEQRQIGFNLHVSSIRRIPPQSVDPMLKNFQWIDLTLGLLDAYEHAADMVVLVDEQGNVTEGPGFNLFALIDGRLVTPRAGVFDGMTRRTIIELCAEADEPVALVDLPAERLADAEEILLASTAGGIMSVTRLGGRPVGSGEPGAMTRRLNDLYWSRKEQGWLGTAVRYDEQPYYAER